jgi:transposase-like protein
MPQTPRQNHRPPFQRHTPRLIGADRERCPYCAGLRITKEGRRYKKLETIQRWKCHDCDKVFTPQLAKGKTFPLAVILDALMRYYQGETRRRIATHLKERYGVAASARKPRQNILYASAKLSRPSLSSCDQFEEEQLSRGGAKGHLTPGRRRAIDHDALLRIQRNQGLLWRRKAGGIPPPRLNPFDFPVPPIVATVVFREDHVLKHRP